MGNARTNVEPVASHVVNECRFFDLDLAIHSPMVLNGLYDEPKCWTDRIHVFIHQSLDNCGFAGIVQSSDVASADVIEYFTTFHSQHQNPHLFIPQSSFAQN